MRKSLVDYHIEHPCMSLYVYSQNNRVERDWGEVNQRLGLPMKNAFVDMQNNGYLDITIPLHKYACGTVGRAVATLMLQRCMEAWNHHPIPGKGQPIAYVPSRRNYVLPEGALPSTDEAVAMYEAAGGQLRDEWEFGEDPFVNDAVKRGQRDDQFWSEVENTLGGVAGIANALANNDYRPLQRAVYRLIELSVV